MRNAVYRYQKSAGCYSSVAESRMEDEEYACSLADLVATLTATAVSLHRSRRSHQASVLSSTEVVGHFPNTCR